MPDQFGGIEVDESPSTPSTIPEVQRDEFGGISVDDEALRLATTVPQQITGRLVRGIELGALAQPEPPQPRRAVVTRAGVREVPPGVPLPGERPLSTDLERLAQSIPQGQNIITRPLSSLARTGLSFASAATAPENVPATVALASPLAPVAEAYFGYQMGKGAMESAKQIYDLMRQPGPVDEAFKQKLSDAIVNAEALGVGATGIGADLLRKAKNKVGGRVRPAPEEIRPAPTPVTPEAAPVAPTAAPTPLTASEQAAERARLASELGEEPEPAAAAPTPAPGPAPVPEAPVEATAPAKPEVANLGDPSTKPNRFGDPAGTTYYATPEDWQAWQEHDARFKKISKDFIEAMRGGDPEKIAEAQKAQLEVGKEHEAFREKYGGMNPEPPKAPAAEPEAAAPTYTGADAIEIVGKPLGEWFKAKTAADLPKRAQRVELAGRIRAKSTKPEDILGALKNEQDRIRRVVTEMAKPPLSPEEAIPMVQPAPTPPTATETTPSVPAAEMPKAPTPTPPTETPPPAPEVGPGPIGMGAAVSEEFEHDPRTPTGIRNAIVDKERVKRGLPEAMKAARRSFGEVWDRAMALIDRDPTTQDELLNTLRDKPRALTDTEDALVLHRQIDLQNEYGKATRDLAQAFDDGRLDDVARERIRVASLADKLLDIYNIGKTSGTETARGLSARRMMANEDFTLARMVTEKRAANQGKPLTDAQNAEIERLNKIIERTQKALDDFQKREAERRGGGPPPTTPPRIDPELERIKADNERAKREYREGLARDRLKERTPAEKAMDWLVQLRQGFVLSGPTTLAKLVSAAIQRMVFTPTEEVVGAGLSKAIPSVASKAAREGGINARAEARALTEGFTAGMRDAWDVMRTGRSSLDIVYGKGMRYPMAIPGLKYIGFLHGALKSATKRNEFARSFEKRAAAAIAQGVDVSDPFVQASIGLEAYKDANRSIFLQDNRVVTAYKAALATLEKRARDTGKTPLAAKSIATTGKILLPIVRVPTNIVAETLQYATGSVTGSARLARAFAKGIENLQPAEADIIMRNLKKGSIGAAVLALGYLNADVIGGYYEPGKRKPQDVPFGRVRVYGHDIPSYLLHNPLLETLQVGATLRRLAESKLSKKDAEAQGIGWGIVGAGMGLLEEVPFLRETVELAKTFRAGERRRFLGELLKSLTVPQGVQWLAATQDVDQYGRPISRKPRTLAESVKTGIPRLREEVPVRPPPKRTP